MVNEHWSQRGVTTTWEADDRNTLESHVNWWLNQYGYAYGGAASKPEQTPEGKWRAHGHRHHSAD